MEAEAGALKAEADEQDAYERFCSARAALRSRGSENEVTETPEFRRWMKARETTDEAWGRWALAMEAAQGH
ncbi:MAG: hypothetical protein HY854_08305 [Burkholderiales bacterium]|nr:hypothetical protein [Burkholderiales bacterium]